MTTSQEPPPSPAVASAPTGYAPPDGIVTVYQEGQVRPHFAGTRWGVCVWPGGDYERVDEYASREKAEQMLRDVYGEHAVLVCHEVSAWTADGAS